MKKYEILPHIADVKIKVFGKTREELFLNALLGMVEVLKPEIIGGKEESREIKVKSLDFKALLIDFLNEALYLGQLNKETYGSIEFKKFSETELEGVLIGKKIERLGEDIKAATHHNLQISQKPNGSWEALILFDI